VGISQLAHLAGESIFCREGWRLGFSQITLGFLVIIIKVPLQNRQQKKAEGEAAG